MSLLKIAGRNRIFSPLRIEAKRMESLLTLGLEDDVLHFNKRPDDHDHAKITFTHPVINAQ